MNALLFDFYIIRRDGMICCFCIFFYHWEIFGALVFTAPGIPISFLFTDVREWAGFAYNFVNNTFRLPFTCSTSLVFLKICSNVLIALKAVLMLNLAKILAMRYETPLTYGIMAKVFVGFYSPSRLRQPGVRKLSLWIRMDFFPIGVWRYVRRMIHKLFINFITSFQNC